MTEGKDAEDGWPICVTHQNCPYQYFLISTQIGQSKLACAECLFSQEQLKRKQEYNTSVPYSIALKSPEIMLDFILKNSKSRYLKNIFEIDKDDLEKQFSEQLRRFDILIDLVTQIKQNFTLHLKEFLEIYEYIQLQKQDFYEKCGFESFNQLIKQLRELNKEYYSEQYQQILLKINSQLDTITKDNFNLINENIDNFWTEIDKRKIVSSKEMSEKFQKQIQQLFLQYDQFIVLQNNTFFQKLYDFKLKIIDQQFLKKILLKIETGQKKIITKFDIVIEGSSKPNLDLFWNKINKKQNLLMIFKHQNNQVFGGYSPCQWQKTTSREKKYISDETNQSFLFSSTQNQIYKLKQDQKDQAICCDSTCGPCFGTDDLLINGDFNSGCSKLGKCYEFDTKPNLKSENQLFGESSPKIVEWAIYEIISS